MSKRRPDRFDFGVFFRSLDDLRRLLEALRVRLAEAEKLIHRAAKDVPRLIQPSAFELACYAYESRHCAGPSRLGRNAPDPTLGPAERSEALAAGGPPPEAPREVRRASAST